MHCLAMGGTADKKENRHRKRSFSRALTVFPGPGQTDPCAGK